jgi:ABC-2 type transport system ATP-binding protein
MSDPSPAIVVDNLSRAFGDLTAVSNLSFSVRSGELFGLLGPDGAGKTTTLRMLAGVMRPSSGDASINAISVVSDPEAVKQKTAYMSQRFGLYTDLSVIENINFYADLFLVPVKARPARLERLFSFSNLGPFKDRLAGALSGGMKQKLGLCCALVHQPSVLLLDEPTFGVDPISRRDLWLIIHEMVGEGTTVVVSTSYMDEAERFDRIALLYEGRLRTVDTPAALQKGFQGEVLIVRTRDVRKVRESVRQIPGVRSAAVFGETLHLIVDSAEEAGQEVETQLGRLGITIIDIHAAAPGMEDVFIEYMARARGGAG